MVRSTKRAIALETSSYKRTITSNENPYMKTTVEQRTAKIVQI
jgi:hypothetical protein